MCKSMLIRVQETELVAAGFPCIDVSRAGLKRGMGGTTTSLVKHVFRLLERALKDCRGGPLGLTGEREHPRQQRSSVHSQ